MGVPRDPEPERLKIPATVVLGGGGGGASARGFRLEFRFSGQGLRIELGGTLDSSNTIGVVVTTIII